MTPPVTGGKEIRIGIFVLLGFAAFLATIFLLTDPATFRGRYIVSTEVENAGGIRRGDPVQMRGVNIGRVHQFDLIPDGVRISLEIEGEWRIPADSRTRLAGVDLLGGRTVEVMPGTSPERLVEGQIMPGASVSGVMELAEELGTDARLTMDRLRELLDEEAVQDMHGSLAELRTLVGSISEVVEGQRSELQTLTASLNRSAGQIEDLTGSAELSRGIARADSTLAGLTVASENLARATGSFETILGRIERGEGTLGLLTNDEDLYRNMNTAIEELVTLTREIRENPGRFFSLSIF